MKEFLKAQTKRQNIKAMTIAKTKTLPEFTVGGCITLPLASVFNTAFGLNEDWKSKRLKASH